MASNRPIELARQAHQAMRALNHATFPGRCEVTDHHDMSSVLADLSALLSGTPQALHQLAGWLTHGQQVARVRVVAGPHAGDPATATAAVESALADAASWCARAARSVEQAHQLAADIVVTGQPTSHQTAPARHSATNTVAPHPGSGLNNLHL